MYIYTFMCIYIYVYIYILVISCHFMRVCHGLSRYGEHPNHVATLIEKTQLHGNVHRENANIQLGGETIRS